MELLASALALEARCPAFPELAHLPTLALKRFAKASPVERFRAQAKLLLDAVDTNAKFVGARRDAAEFSPKDTDQIAAFLKCA
jgi:nucleolar complex protein 2